MALTGLNWPNTNTVQRRYYELAAGYVSPRFDQILQLSDTAGDGPASSPQSTVTVQFTSQTPSGIPIPGVTLDQRTGQVTIPATLPSLPPGQSWPQEMEITCEAKEGTKSFPDKAKVRVRVHQKLDRVWLCPNPLTVRKDAMSVRLSLLGRFSDGRFGDLSNWCPRELADPSGPIPPADDRRFVHLGSSSNPVVRWSAAGSGIAVESERTGVLLCSSETASATITARVDQSPALSATASVKGAPSWGTRTLLVPLTPSSTFASMRKRKNVLVLPEGFDKDSREEFVDYARDFIDKLGKRSLTRPYDLLKTKFNWFTAWTPSPQSDISTLTELMRVAYTGPPLPLTTTPYDGVGFSVSVPGAIQLLVNERDTAFHVAHGTRPDITYDGSEDWLNFNPQRMHVDDINAFLFHLSSKPADISHIPEGRTYWATGGNDEQLVVFLCRGAHAGAVNSGWKEKARAVFLTLLDEKRYPLIEEGSGNGYELLTAGPNKKTAKQSVRLTIAHELGHSLRLGDEYGEEAPPIPDRKFPVIRSRANIQMLQDFPSGLSGGDLKWLWARAKKAAPYSSLSHPDAQGIFTCDLPTSYAEQSCKPDKIRPGDEVRLRLRNLLFNSKMSTRLEVVSVEEFKIKLRLKSGSAPLDPLFLPNIGSGPPGVMIVSPKNDLGIALNIVHFAVQVHISTPMPLNATAGATSWTCVPTAKKKTLGAPTNLPTTTPPTKWPPLRSWIVGAFEGGHNYTCDIYHPTGECVMIDPDKAKQFCHVCRYALVDLIDPLKHGAIDRDFDPNYPE